MNERQVVSAIGTNAKYTFPSINLKNANIQQRNFSCEN